MKTVTFDMKALENWADDVEKLLAEELETFLLEATKALAAEFIQRVKGSIDAQRTPVKTGQLRDGWNIKEITKTADGYEVHIVNNVDYAEYVEYGHRKVNKDGQTVGWQKGSFMMTITESEVDTFAPEVLEEQFEMFLRKVTGL